MKQQKTFIHAPCSLTHSLSSRERSINVARRDGKKEMELRSAWRKSRKVQKFKVVYAHIDATLKFSLLPPTHFSVLFREKRRQHAMRRNFFSGFLVSKRKLFARRRGSKMNGASEEGSMCPWIVVTIKYLNRTTRSLSLSRWTNCVHFLLRIIDW